MKGQVNYTKWVNPNIYNSVTLASKSMETDEYNELVSEILHLTNQHSLSISDLESFFKQMMEDVKKNIVMVKSFVQLFLLKNCLAHI